jgi:hypothetical protein
MKAKPAVFAFFCFLESGLFKGLQAIQMLFSYLLHPSGGAFCERAVDPGN